MTSGSCYKYQYVVSDNVGNPHTATSANVVKVPPAAGPSCISNGGFEGGTGWTQSPSGVLTNGAGAVAGTHRHLEGAARRSAARTTTETVTQSVTIPAGCTRDPDLLPAGHHELRRQARRTTTSGSRSTASTAHGVHRT